MANRWGANSDFAIATRIAAILGKSLDEIFVKKLSSEGRQPWVECAPQEVEELYRKIDYISSREHFQMFFKNHPGHAVVLDLLRKEIPEASTAEQVEAYNLALEDASLDEYVAGLPIILVPIEPFYLSLLSGDDGYPTPEPDLRVIAPFEARRRRALEKVSASLWQSLVGVFDGAQVGTTPDPQQPGIITGTYITGSGAEALSFSTGERLAHFNVMFLPNIVKNTQEIEAVTGLAGERRNVPDLYQFLVFFSHEFSHCLYDVKNSVLVELVPDLAMILAGVQYIQKIPPQEQTKAFTSFLSVVVAECVRNLGDADRPYPISAATQLNFLKESGAVSFDAAEGRLTFHPEAASALVEYCRSRLYEALKADSLGDNGIFLESLNASPASDDMKALVDAVLTSSASIRAGT